MAQSMHSGGDPEVLKRIIDGQVARCREELMKAEHYAKAGDMDAMRRRLDRLKTIVKTSRLPSDILGEIKDKTLKVELDGLKKAIDLLLGRAADCARVDDLLGRANAIKPAREHLGRAITLGAGDDFKIVTEKKIEIIMQTDSSQAVAKKGAESSRLGAVKRPEVEAVHPTERRRYKRFRTPALELTVGSRKYTCVVWSIGGAVLPDWEGPDEGRFDVKFKAEGHDAGFADAIEIVRMEGAAACVKFVDPTHSSLKLVQRLTTQGQAPKE